MSADVFLDTRVLVCAAIGTGRDEPKRRRAVELIESEDLSTSAQVLQEFYMTVMKKGERPLPAPRRRREPLPYIPRISATNNARKRFGW
jgi:predicted nucleic acid-binding protein